MKFQRLQVTLDTKTYSDLGTSLRIRLNRSDYPHNLYVEKIIPDNDFENHWDYIWNACKRLLDDELKKEK